MTQSHLLKTLQNKEIQLHQSSSDSVETSLKMIQFLKNTLLEYKQKVVSVGFKDQESEIEFFKKVKPTVLGKLIFYNKIYKLEVNLPLDRATLKQYYNNHLKDLHQEYHKHFYHNELYRYYNAKRTDKDVEYFTLGKTEALLGLPGFFYEIDPLFSTYYDYKMARIIAHDLLQHYLSDKVQDLALRAKEKDQGPSQIQWSDSQSALIELIYALYASKSINNGTLEIRKIALGFEQLFQVKLLDVHHVFHRMKTRAKSQTCYLDKLRDSLQDYMNKS